MYWKRHIWLARTVFAHVLRLFIKAGVDRIILVPSDQASRPRILGIREPVVNAGYILSTDLAGPRVLLPLAVCIHFKQVPDQFASHACMGLDLLKQGSGSPVLELLRVTLDAGRDLHIHFAIDRCFQFVAAEVFHPGFGVFVGVEVVVHAHPFVQVGGEYLVEGSWQESVFSFEAGERRTNWNGSGGFVVADQIQMIGHPFSSGFNLIPLVLGQFEKTVRNSQVANPDSLRVSCAVLRAKPFETAFDKVHRAARPVIGPANSQSQQAHPQNGGRPFIPPRAVPPSNSLDPGKRDI